MSRSSKVWKATEQPKKGAAYMRSIGKVYYGAWVSRQFRDAVKEAAKAQGISAERYVTMAIMSSLGYSDAKDERAARVGDDTALYDTPDDYDDGRDDSKPESAKPKAAKPKAAKPKAAKPKAAKRKAVR